MIPVWLAQAQGGKRVGNGLISASEARAFYPYAQVGAARPLGGEQGAVWVNAPGDLFQDFLLGGRDGSVSAWLLPMAGKWLRAMQG